MRRPSFTGIVAMNPSRRTRADAKRAAGSLRTSPCRLVREPDHRPLIEADDLGCRHRREPSASGRAAGSIPCDLQKWEAMLIARRFDRIQVRLLENEAGIALARRPPQSAELAGGRPRRPARLAPLEA
jgi:hypothetical protein